jgi:hypothetical protein
MATLTDLSNATKPINAAIATLSARMDTLLHEITVSLTRIDAKVDRLEHHNVEIEPPRATVNRRKQPKVEDSDPTPIKRRGAAKSSKTATDSKKSKDVEEPTEPDSEEEQSNVESGDEVVVELPKPKAKPKSKAAPKPTAPKRVTVMSAFKDKYKEDPAFFDEYITDDVKESLSEEYPGLKTLEGDKLLALELKVYYPFIKENYAELLNELKAAMQ